MIVPTSLARLICIDPNWLQLSPPRKPAGFGGVHSAADIKAENLIKQQRRAALLAGMSADDSGVGAATVHRDAQGRRIDPKLERK